LDRWDYVLPTVVVSFDSPTSKTSIGKQVSRAKKLFQQFPGASSELLLKTSKRSQKMLDMTEVVSERHQLAGIDIIGVTEKELGNSTLERMVNIARLRNALSSVGLETPIHIFGSLDTIGTPLYFLAGADIFDGLTWLRYAFHEGNTIYKHNYGAKELGIGFEDFRVNGKVWNDNYYYMNKLKEDMTKYLSIREFGAFRFNADVYKHSCSLLAGRMGEELGTNGR